MANSINSLTDVSAAAGQLKNTFSSLEKIQISALSGTSGSLSSFAGTINGNISDSITNLSNTAKSRLEAGFSLAENLEIAGISLNNSSSIISNSLSNAINNKSGFDQYLFTSPVDMSNPKNRLPSANKERPDDIIARNKENVVGVSDLKTGIQFPLDLKSKAPTYLGLNFIKYSRENAIEPGITESVGVIYLPMPENLAESFSVVYDQRESGGYGELLKTSPEVSEALGGLAEFDLAEAKAALGKISNENVKQQLTQLGTRGIFAGLSGADEVLGGLAGQITGNIPNPHPTVFFKGLNLRTFQFNWRLIPRNKDEAEVIQKIIKNIKRLCLPEKGGETTLKYPHLVQIIPSGDGKDKIGKYKKSLVSGIVINYTPEGTSAFFYDGHPVAIQLSLDFQEVENFTSEDV